MGKSLMGESHFMILAQETRWGSNNGGRIPLYDFGGVSHAWLLRSDLVGRSYIDERAFPEQTFFTAQFRVGLCCVKSYIVAPTLTKFCFPGISFNHGPVQGLALAV